MSPARYRMAGTKRVMSYYSGIPKKFRLLWIQFLKSTVFYGINSKKVLVLFGARQVGKTTMLKNCVICEICVTFF